MNIESYNLYKIAQQQFDHAADLLDLDQAMRDLLRVPIREFHFGIPIRMNNGERKIFRGYRVQHNDARGPGKGGIRFHPLQTIDSIRGMAMWMTWRAAIVDLPLGGSMGGVICDPHDLSLDEQESISRGWVRKIYRNLGPEIDVPSPDLMTGDQHMMWMLDEYELIVGKKKPGFITGKPVGLGGSYGRKEATGYGVMVTIREALKELNISPDNTLASFQGFGNVAQNAIELYTRMGGKVLSVSCWNQSNHCAYTFRKKEGIDLNELRKITNVFGEIDKQKAIDAGYECLDGDQWIQQEVDILIPAAIESQITLENVNKIHKRAKIIAEGAHGPTNPDAEKVINERGIVMIPDLLANAGDVICSYYEQVQGNMNYFWRRDEVLGKLDTQMTAAYMEVRNMAQRNSLNMRDSVYVIAVERVASACQARGWR